MRYIRIIVQILCILSGSIQAGEDNGFDEFNSKSCADCCEYFFAITAMTVGAFAGVQIANYVQGDRFLSGFFGSMVLPVILSSCLGRYCDDHSEQQEERGFVLPTHMKTN